MGCSGSRDVLLQVQQQRSRQIDKEISAEKKIKKLKFLLLGVSESGKTTLFRQMRILHANGFSLSERMYYRNVIKDNLLQYTKVVIRNMHLLNIPFDDQISETHANMFLTNTSKCQRLLDFEAELKHLYHTQGFQACATKGQDYCLGDGAHHLFRSFDRIASPDYIPTDQDILHARVITTGVTELCFKFKDHTFCMVDVGGQRSERRKWIHCFENVTAVIFVTAMTFYHQINDSKKNKLHESLLVFKSLCTNQYLSKSAFLVFLNKMDVFKVMIQRKSLKCCFPSYKGGKSFMESAQYITCQFENAGRRKSGVYTHYTTATDTENFDRVFDTSMALLLEQNLAVTGLL